MFNLTFSIYTLTQNKTIFLNHEGYYEIYNRVKKDAQLS